MGTTQSRHHLVCGVFCVSVVCGSVREGWTPGRPDRCGDPADKVNEDGRGRCNGDDHDILCLVSFFSFLLSCSNSRVFTLSWSFGLNGIPWIVSAEIFPGALRNLTGTFAALVQWLIQFAITKALPYIFTSFGYGTWFFFASWMLVATVWAIGALPETKGLTLEQMDDILYVLSPPAPAPSGH